VRVPRSVFALLVSLILVVAVAQPAAADELLAKVNAARSSNVSLLQAADSLAQKSANAQAAAGTLSHTNINSLLGTCSAVGEVVGLGSSIDAVFKAFRGSPTHWNIITAPNWTAAGTGVAVDSDGTVYVSIVFCEESGAPAPAPTTPTTTATTTTRPPARTTTSTRATPRATELVEPFIIRPCSMDRDLVLHEPPWETGSCPGVT